MADISRRRLLSWTAMAPVAVATGVALGGVSSVAGGSGRLTQSELARRRIQRLHLPNVPLLTHEGKQVMFYDDLIKNKAVSLNFFFAKCDEICPRVTANLAKVQELLGADLGTKIFMYSFTLKPEEDDPEAIRRYRQMFNAKPGWTFLTGKPEDMEKLKAYIQSLNKIFNDT